MSCIRKRAPGASSPSVRKVMQHNVGHTTGIESRLQAALTVGGLAFEVDQRVESDLRWKADVVFPQQRICVFVDGCFWHGCPAHFRPPHSNSAWWTEKIQANVDRDCRQKETLGARGWKVFRFWEHELGTDCNRCVQKILRALKRAGSTGPSPRPGPAPRHRA
jgi:DNA mismatch endonuclease (patch repair protein)